MLDCHGHGKGFPLNSTFPFLSSPSRSTSVSTTFYSRYYRSKPDCGPRIRPESELTSLFLPTSWQLWVTMLLRWGFLKPSPDTYSLAPDHRATSRLKIRGCGGFAWGILSVVQVSLRLKNWICRRNHSFGDPENWVRDSCHLSNEGLSMSAMRWTCIQWGTSSQCRA